MMSQYFYVTLEQFVLQPAPPGMGGGGGGGPKLRFSPRKVVTFFISSSTGTSFGAIL